MSIEIVVRVFVDRAQDEDDVLDLEQKEEKIPFSLIRNQLPGRYPLLSENSWAVIGTGACFKLYEAAKVSARHKAVLVISA